MWYNTHHRETKIKNIFEKILDISFCLCYNIYRKKKGKDNKMKTIIQKIINFFSAEDKTYKVKFINYEGKEIETDMNVTSIQNLYNSGCKVISIIWYKKVNRFFFIYFLLWKIHFSYRLGRCIFLFYENQHYTT